MKCSFSGFLPHRNNFRCLCDYRQNLTIQGSIEPKRPRHTSCSERVDGSSFPTLHGHGHWTSIRRFNDTGSWCIPKHDPIFLTFWKPVLRRSEFVIIKWMKIQRNLRPCTRHSYKFIHNSGIALNIACVCRCWSTTSKYTVIAYFASWRKIIRILVEVKAPKVSFSLVY